MCLLCRKNSKFQRIYEAEENSEEDTTRVDDEGINKNIADVDHSDHKSISNPDLLPSSIHITHSIPFLFIYFLDRTAHIYMYACVMNFI